MGATYSAAQLVGAPVLGRWSDRHGRRPILLLSQFVAQGPVLRFGSRSWSPRGVFVAGLVGLIISFVLFALPQSAALYGGALMFALGNGIAWPTFQARLAEAAPSDAQGASTSAGSLASIIGLVAGGILYPWLGVGLFVAGATMFAAVLLAAPRLFREAPR